MPICRRQWAPFKLQNALNAYLRLPGARRYPRGRKRQRAFFDARFSALRRHYLYRIITRRAPLALEAGKAWWVAKALDHDAMHAAAQMLVGKHDFTTFRSAHCQANSPVAHARPAGCDAGPAT
jgi:tRNA pseudouridine38-40 synthase